MATNGPFHRSGTPGGTGCPVTMIPVEGKSSEGLAISGMLLDAGDSATELTLLRTVAAGLGMAWGKDEIGWWAVVSNSPISTFGSTAPISEPEQCHALFREDDNGVRFSLIPLRHWLKPKIVRQSWPREGISSITL